MLSGSQKYIRLLNLILLHSVIVSVLIIVLSAFFREMKMCEAIHHSPESSVILSSFDASLQALPPFIVEKYIRMQYAYYSGHVNYLYYFIFATSINRQCASNASSCASACCTNASASASHRARQAHNFCADV